MRIALDVETTGLDASKDAITSIAWMVVDTPEVAVHSLIQPNGWTIPEEVVAITGITTEQCREHGEDIVEILWDLDCFIGIMGKTQIWAHNAQFDWGFIGPIARRENMENLIQAEWKCSGLETRGIMGLGDAYRIDTITGESKPRFANLRKTVEKVAPFLLEGIEDPKFHDAMFDATCVAAIVSQIDPKDPLELLKDILGL
jgi:DNA polymerase III epsilon subunit-like protein